MQKGLLQILQSDWSCQFSGGGTNPGIGLTPNFPFLAEGRPRSTRRGLPFLRFFGQLKEAIEVVDRSHILATRWEVRWASYEEVVKVIGKVLDAT